jgi:L-lactate dehydrogenase complex protein LldG
MSSEKEKIFRRIREALTTPAPHPGDHGPPLETPISEEEEGNRGGRRAGEPRLASAPSHLEPPPETISHWLPPVGPAFAAQADLFARNSVQLKSTFHLLESEPAAAQKLAEIARAESWRRVAAHSDGAHGPSTRAIVSALNLPGLWTDSGYDVREMESCDAGVTECDALVAQTGSVLVTTRSAGGRALSVLPPHHVVLARRDQLLPDLPAAFALLEQKYAQSYPSFIGFITGPSRTGDIERILVLGAHGPKKLTILCW